MDNINTGSEAIKTQFDQPKECSFHSANAIGWADAKNGLWGVRQTVTDTEWMKMKLAEESINHE